MPLRLIYVVALVEGYSTLAVEIIAMRLAIPVVGSSIILTSVFLGVVLLALSAGYWSGGVLSSNLKKENIPKHLAGFLLFSGFWYVFVSFAFERELIHWLLNTFDHYVLSLFLVAFLLFFLPVFIASHTLPLLTELLPDTSKGKSAGKILFVSTIGSFLGSVVTTIVLFEVRGVAKSGVYVGASLIFLAFLVYYTLGKKALAFLAGLLFTGMIVYSFSPSVKSNVLTFDTAYQEIRIYDRFVDERDIRVFSMNGALSSAVYLDSDEYESPFAYLQEIQKITEKYRFQDTLLVGTAGGVYPMYAAQKPYTKYILALDIDSRVQALSEEYFFEKKWDEKIDFRGQSARYGVQVAAQEDKMFDLVFLDAYNGKSAPAELMTIDFFEDVYATLDNDGVLLANVILDAELGSNFAQSVLASMTEVFGQLYVKNITQNPGYHLDNILVSQTALDGFDLYEALDEDIVLNYDNKHSLERDMVEMMY